MTKDASEATRRRGLPMALAVVGIAGAGLATAAYLLPGDRDGLRGRLHVDGPWRAFTDTGGTISVWRADDPAVMATIVGRAVVIHGAPLADCGRGRRDPAHTLAISLTERDDQLLPSVRRGLGAVRPTRRAARCRVVPASQPTTALWEMTASTGTDPAPAAVTRLRPQVAAALARRPTGRAVTVLGTGSPPELPADSDVVGSRRGTLERRPGSTLWQSDDVTYVASYGQISRDRVGGLVISQGADVPGWVSVAADRGQLTRVERPSAFAEAEIERDAPPPAEFAAEIARLDDTAAWLETGRRTALDEAESLRFAGEQLDVLLTSRGLAVATLAPSHAKPVGILGPNGALTVRTWGSVAFGGRRIQVRATTRFASFPAARVGDIGGLTRQPGRRLLRAGSGRVTLVLAERVGVGERDAILDRAARRVVLTREPSLLR